MSHHEHRRPQSDRGQTLTEYVSLLGLLSATIIALSVIIVPAFGWVIVKLVQYFAIYMGSGAD